MKLSFKIFIISLIIISSQKVVSQKVFNQNDLCRQWLIEKVIVNGEVAPLNDVLLKTSIKFFKNHTFIKLPKDKNVKTSTWKLVQPNKLELYNNERLIGIIKYVDRNHLIFVPTFTQPSKNSKLKAPEYYLKCLKI